MQKPPGGGIHRITRILRFSRSPGRQVQNEGRRGTSRLLGRVVPRPLRTEGAALRRMLGFGPRRKGAVVEDGPRVSAGLETAPELSAVPAAARPRRGPATIYERRVRLESVVQRAVERGERLEYQANTIAVIDPGSALLRFLKALLALLLLPLALLARLCGRGHGGNGRLKRRLVTVDRRGNVHVRRV